MYFLSFQGFPGSRNNGNGRHSPGFISPPIYTPSNSEGAASPPLSILNQTCFVFPAMADNTNSLPPPTLIQQPKEACSKCGNKRYFSFSSPIPNIPAVCGDCSASLPKLGSRAHRRMMVHKKCTSESVLNTIIDNTGSSSSSSSSDEEPISTPTESDSHVSRLRESSTDSSSGRTQPSGDSMSRTPFSSLESKDSPCALPPPPPGGSVVASRGNPGGSSGASRSFSGSAGTSRSLTGSDGTSRSYSGSARKYFKTGSESNLKKMSRHSSLDENKCSPIKPPPRTTSLIASLIERRGPPPAGVGLGRMYNNSPNNTTSKESVSSSRHSINGSQTSLPIDSRFCDRIKKKTNGVGNYSGHHNHRPMLLNAASINSDYCAPRPGLNHIKTNSVCDSGIALRADTPDLPTKTKHYGAAYRHRTDNTQC